MKHQKEEKAQTIQLIDRILDLGYPRSVVLATEPGRPNDKGPRYADPRLSLCLSGQGAYQILREGRLTTISLERGEAIVVQPGSLMGSHPEGRYLSFGLVFSPDMIRILLAKRTPQSVGGRNRFLLAYHAPAVMDDEIRSFLEITANASQRKSGADYGALLVRLILLRTRELAEKLDTGGAGASFTWNAAKEYVDENLHRPLNRSEIADFLRIHPNHVSRLFRQFGSTSLRHYLAKARMMKANTLLNHPSLRISEIAQACGIPDANYFTRCYRKAFGHPPTLKRGRL